MIFAVLGVYAIKGIVLLGMAWLALRGLDLLSWILD